MFTPWRMTTRPALSVNQRPECEMVPTGAADAATVVGVGTGTRFFPDVDACELLHAPTASDAATVAETNVANVLGIGSDRRPRMTRANAPRLPA